MEENIFNKVPNWLRYILSVPLGIVAVIIVYIIGYWSNLWVASPDSLMMQFFTFIYQNGINVFILIGTICYVLPKYQIQFTITISVLICALGFIGLGMSILLDNITVTYIIGFVLTFVSFILTCIYVFKQYSKKQNNNTNPSNE